jgi:hypothetical protein
MGNNIKTDYMASDFISSKYYEYLFWSQATVPKNKVWF